MKDKVLVDRRDLREVLRCFGTLKVHPSDPAIAAAKRLHEILEPTR